VSPPVYTYLTTDLATGAILGEIPLGGVTLDDQMNTVGNMNAGGNLDDKRIDNDTYIQRTIPGKTGLFAYRNDQIVWGGIIWTREYQSNGKALTITGQTFESYAARRFPRSWLGTSKFVYNQGQISIIDNLWAKMQAVPNGNINVQPCGVYPPNDVVRQLTVNGFDLTTSFNDLIQSILLLSGAPDYNVTWYEDQNGLPKLQLQIAVPIGHPVAATQLVVDYPGPISDYVFNENASSGNNQWWAVGDGTDAAANVGVVTDSASLANGYPLLEGVNSYSGVTDQSTITAHAASDLSSFPAPVVTHNVDLVGTAFPMFGTYAIGDYVQAYVTDARFPAGASFNVRVIGWTITPPDTGSGVENIALIYDEPTALG